MLMNLNERIKMNLYIATLHRASVFTYTLTLSSSQGGCWGS